MTLSCPHGQLRRSCEICDLIEQVTELERFILSLDAHKCGERYYVINEMQSKLGRCPFPIDGDETAKQCVANGHCGCANANR